MNCEQKEFYLDWYCPTDSYEGVGTFGESFADCGFTMITDTQTEWILCPKCENKLHAEDSAELKEGSPTDDL